MCDKAKTSSLVLYPWEAQYFNLSKGSKVFFNLFFRNIWTQPPHKKPFFLGGGFLSFFNPHLRISSLILETARERETSMQERTSDWLPAAHTQSGDQTGDTGCALSGNLTCDPLAYGTMLQPPEPPHPGRGSFPFRALAPSLEAQIQILLIFQ